MQRYHIGLITLFFILIMHIIIEAKIYKRKEMKLFKVAYDKSRFKYNIIGLLFIFDEIWEYYDEIKLIRMFNQSEVYSQDYLVSMENAAILSLVLMLIMIPIVMVYVTYIDYRTFGLFYKDGFYGNGFIKYSKIRNYTIDEIRGHIRIRYFVRFSKTRKIFIKTNEEETKQLKEVLDKYARKMD